MIQCITSTGNLDKEKTWFVDQTWLISTLALQTNMGGMLLTNIVRSVGFIQVMSVYSLHKWIYVKYYNLHKLDIRMK